MQKNTFPLLENITKPENIKLLNLDELNQLAQEVRSFLITQLSTTPGHFGASLGVVELTIALHYIFDAPFDKIVWDVGHQAYVHKILTGRRERFSSLRQLKGLSGFPNIFESPYDAFTTGHSSTSISSALGMSIAFQLQNKTNHSVAVVGDASITSGMAFEGLNNAGVAKSNILIVLNDNNMAIDPSVGAMSKYFARFTASKRYNKLKENVWNKLGYLNKVGDTTRELIRKVDTSIKVSIVENSNFFESLGLRYFGPIDGHSIRDLVDILEDLKEIKGPKILHVKTQKGKGYKFAETNQVKWHATSEAFDIETGEKINKTDKKPLPPKFQDVFGETIIELADKNEKIVAITPAMLSGSSLLEMQKVMPHRVFDVGIAEQHAVTFSAGLASNGILPFCNIYSTFMQRAFDQVIHDVALQNYKVVFCLDRGGLVGADGATHHGAFDLSYMRLIPNLVISAPRNEIELRNLMYSAQLPKHQFPWVIRYPRGRGELIDWKKPFEEIEQGKGVELRKGERIAVLSIGAIGREASKAAKTLARDKISIGHYDMRFVKPLDEELLLRIAKEYEYIITLEDNSIIGGFGSAVSEFLSAKQLTNKLFTLGIPDRFIEHGTQAELYKLCRYDHKEIVKLCRNLNISKHEKND